MGKFPGYKMVLQIETKSIVGYRSTDMELSADMAEATTAESEDQWKEYTPMFKGGKFSVGGLYDPTAGSDSSVNDVIALLVAGTAVTCLHGGKTAGDVTQSAEGFIQNVKISGPYDDLASYTVDIQITGKVTPGTVAA